jgi:hypothetical protein
MPFVVARLADGNRVHAVRGTLASGICISLRVPAQRKFSLEDRRTLNQSWPRCRLPSEGWCLAMVWCPEGVVARLGGPAVMIRGGSRRVWCPSVRQAVLDQLAVGRGMTRGRLTRSSMRPASGWLRWSPQTGRQHHWLAAPFGPSGPTQRDFQPAV